MKPNTGLVYVVCPQCGTQRKKDQNRKWTIIKRGYERNGTARFLCRKCGAWFNEKSGQAMEWYER